MWPGPQLGQTLSVLLHFWARPQPIADAFLLLPEVFHLPLCGGVEMTISRGKSWALPCHSCPEGCGILFVSAFVLKVSPWFAPRIWTKKQRLPPVPLRTSMAPSEMQGTADCHIHRIRGHINAILRSTASTTNLTYDRSQTTLQPFIHLDHLGLPGQGHHGHLAALWGCAAVHSLLRGEGRSRQQQPQHQSCDNWRGWALRKLGRLCTSLAI